MYVSDSTLHTKEDGPFRDDKLFTNDESFGPLQYIFSIPSADHDFRSVNIAQHAHAHAACRTGLGSFKLPLLFTCIRPEDCVRAFETIRWMMDRDDRAAVKEVEEV